MLKNDGILGETYLFFDGMLEKKTCRIMHVCAFFLFFLDISKHFPPLTQSARDIL